MTALMLVMLVYLNSDPNMKFTVNAVIKFAGEITIEVVYSISNITGLNILSLHRNYSPWLKRVPNAFIICPDRVAALLVFSLSIPINFDIITD